VNEAEEYHLRHFGAEDPPISGEDRDSRECSCVVTCCRSRQAALGSEKRSSVNPLTVGAEKRGREPSLERHYEVVRPRKTFLAKQRRGSNRREKTVKSARRR